MEIISHIAVSMEPSSAVDKVFRLYETHGNTGYLGEAISKTSHSIQCAMLAEKEGFSGEIILAAFLHDIGHLIGEDKEMPAMVTDGVHLGAKDHDIVGGNFLRDLGFPENVCHLVQGHVQAKRYLVWKDKQYYSNLSPASRMTLEHQGGVMSDDEAKAFEQDPLHDVILRMRRWDELGKETDVDLPTLDKYKSLCRQVLGY